MKPMARPLKPARIAVANATRFFRRLDQSDLKSAIQGIDGDPKKAAEMLARIVVAMAEGLPSKEAMDAAAKMLRQGMVGRQPGDGYDMKAVANLCGAAKYWDKVPNSLTYLMRRSGVPIIVPSDEPEFDCKLGKAGILDMPREMLWMDDELFYEAYARGALTKFEWNRRIWEPTHVKVTFIVDVSGSMEGAPMHIATACALKLSKLAKENGHSVSVVFFASRTSEEYTPEQAFRIDTLRNLGGGTSLWPAISKVLNSPSGIPDTLVLCTDFEVNPPPAAAREALAKIQVFGMFPGTSRHTEAVERLAEWVPNPSGRIRLKMR
jgi:hypothetical protein